jgi:hypothetical protein
MKTLEPLPPHIEGPTWRRYNDGSWFLPDRSLGWELLGWIAEYLRSPTGDGRFMCTLEQARFLLWWYAVDERGEFIYRSGTLRRMKGAGKDVIAAAMSLAELCGPVAFSHFDESGDPVGKPRFNAWVQLAAVSYEQPLALDTVVPTPTGWTTVGELKIGDDVLDSEGKPAKVMRGTPVMTGLDCYRVTFDCGESIVASGSHGWTTERLNGHGDKFETVTVTTEELAATCLGPKKRKRHRIAATGMELPPVNLPVDPWFLGYWLGDGFTADSGFVCAIKHREELSVLMKEVMDEHQTLVWADHITDKGSWSTGRIRNSDRTKDETSFRSKLRAAGVLNNKHIPPAYMFSGTEQRRELLRGLIDSDGGVDSQGQAYFVNRNHQLVFQVYELAVGLGFRPHLRRNGEALNVGFRVGDEWPVAKLADKANRQKPWATGRSGGTAKYHRIESVDKVKSVPVKCIGIDTDDHLFQVTRRRILTHNTKNTRMLFPALITDHMKNTFKLEVGKTIIYSGAGGRIESLTSSPFAAEGNRPTFVVLNECQYFFEANSGHALAQVIEGNVTKVQGSRKLSICNAHVPGMDSVAERDWDAFQRVKAGDAIDTGVLYDSLEAPAGTPVSEIPAKDVDPDGHEQGLKRLREGIEIARGDAVWLPVNSIMDSILDTRNSVSESRRKYLNQVNAAEDSWISPQEWDRCAVTSEALALKANDRITLGFDGSKSSDWSALVACRVEDGFLTPIKVWNPKRYPNEEIPRDDVDATVRACFEQFDVVAFRADVKEFENYVDTWGRDFRRQLKINASRGHPVAFDMRGQKKPFSLDCESFLEAVLEEEICHSGDPILRQHVLNAKRHPTNWGAVSIRKVSRDSSRKIDAAVCAVLAFGARREYLNSKKVRTGHVAIIQ